MLIEYSRQIVCFLNYQEIATISQNKNFHTNPKQVGSLELKKLHIKPSNAVPHHPHAPNDYIFSFASALAHKGKV